MIKVINESNARRVRAKIDEKPSNNKVNTSDYFKIPITDIIKEIQKTLPNYDIHTSRTSFSRTGNKYTGCRFQVQIGYGVLATVSIDFNTDEVTIWSDDEDGDNAVNIIANNVKK